MGDLANNFSRNEFACNCGCGFDTVDAELLKVLRGIRMFFRSEVIINSGCRCTKHNTSVGGSPQSMHLIGRAADITVAGFVAEEVQWYLTGMYMDKYGIGSYKSFTHVDTRSGGKARWVG